MNLPSFPARIAIPLSIFRTIHFSTNEIANVTKSQIQVVISVIYLLIGTAMKPDFLSDSLDLWFSVSSKNHRLGGPNMPVQNTDRDRLLATNETFGTKAQSC